MRVLKKKHFALLAKASSILREAYSVKCNPKADVLYVISTCIIKLHEVTPMGKTVAVHSPIYQRSKKLLPPFFSSRQDNVVLKTTAGDLSAGDKLS